MHVALGQIAADRVLTDALRAGNLAAARAEAIRQVVHGRKHVTAIRVVRGNRVLVETGAYPFDVAGAQAPLHDRHGAVLGTLQVTIQDVIGFIRLVHKYGASQVVVRGSRGEAKTSLPAALAVRLPATGCATVAGRDYAVRSFGEARLRRRVADDLDPHSAVGRTQPSHRLLLPAAQARLLPSQACRFGFAPPCGACSPACSS